VLRMNVDLLEMSGLALDHLNVRKAQARFWGRELRVNVNSSSNA
jgi:hypothetical protein